MESHVYTFAREIQRCVLYSHLFVINVTECVKIVTFAETNIFNVCYDYGCISISYARARFIRKQIFFLRCCTSFHGDGEYYFRAVNRSFFTLTNAARAACVVARVGVVAPTIYGFAIIAKSRTRAGRHTVSRGGNDARLSIVTSTFSVRACVVFFNAGDFPDADEFRLVPS